MRHHGRATAGTLSAGGQRTVALQVRDELWGIDLGQRDPIIGQALELARETREVHRARARIEPPVADEVATIADPAGIKRVGDRFGGCLLYTSDAADE